MPPSTKEKFYLHIPQKECRFYTLHPKIQNKKKINVTWLLIKIKKINVIDNK